MMKTRKLIREYLIEASLCDKEKISDETLIFEQGLLDSMGLLFLVQFLNDEFKVIINDQELLTENFASINAIVSFLERKLKIENPLPTTQMPA